MPASLSARDDNKNADDIMGWGKKLAAFKNFPRIRNKRVRHKKTGSGMTKLGQAPKPDSECSSFSLGAAPFCQLDISPNGKNPIRRGREWRMWIIFVMRTGRR
jgi:hypothetical protein